MRVLNARADVDDARRGVAAGAPHRNGASAEVDVAIPEAGVGAVGDEDGVAIDRGVDAGLDGPLGAIWRDTDGGAAGPGVVPAWINVVGGLGEGRRCAQH